MEDLKKIGIEYLSDTLDGNKLDLLLHQLISKWNEILLFDWTIDKGGLSKKERINVKDYRNQSFWIQCNNKRNKLSRERKRYNKLLLHSKKIHQYIREQIINTWCKLTVLESESINHKCCKLTNSIGKTKHTYPNWVYDLKPDDPERKYLRNEKSNPRHNLIRRLEPKVKRLIKLGYESLINHIPITNIELTIIKELKEVPRWSETVSIILKHHEKVNIS